MRVTDAKVKDDVAASGGGVFWVGETGMPQIRRVGARPVGVRVAAGSGLRANGDYVVTGVAETPLLPGSLALALALGFLILAWRREGR